MSLAAKSQMSLSDRATAPASDFQKGKQCGAHQAREQRFQHEAVILRKNFMDRCSNAVRRYEISNNLAARLPLQCLKRNLLCRPILRKRVLP